MDNKELAETDNKELAKTMIDKQGDKLIEALKVVFMNKEVRNEFESMLGRTQTNSISQKKLINLESELDIPVWKIWKRLQVEVMQQ